MSNKPAVTTLTRTTDLPAELNALGYAVSDPQVAWGRFDRLVGKVLEYPKSKNEAGDIEQAGKPEQPKRSQH